MTETPASCVSENATLSQLDDMPLNELICALNAPMEDESETPGTNSIDIQRFRVFSFMKCAGKMDGSQYPPDTLNT